MLQLRPASPLPVRGKFCKTAGNRGGRRESRRAGTAFCAVRMSSLAMCHFTFLPAAVLPPTLFVRRGSGRGAPAASSDSSLCVSVGHNVPLISQCRVPGARMEAGRSFQAHLMQFAPWGARNTSIARARRSSSAECSVRGDSGWLEWLVWWSALLCRQHPPARLRPPAAGLAPLC